MILRILLVLLPFLSMGSQLQAGWWDNIKSSLGFKEKPTPPKIRVLVVHDVEGVQLEVRGMYSLFDPYTNSYMSTRYTGKSRYIQAFSGGLKWGEAFPGLYQLKIRPDEPQTITMIDGKPYRGVLYVYDIGGSISIVNEVPIEDYVMSILNNQDFGDLHPEVLSALAIVARTNAYFQAVNPKNTYWAVDAQKVGYEGVFIPEEPTEMEEAVVRTRYMIMSRTGVYEGVATPFAAEFGAITPTQSKEIETAKLTLEQANQMAENGAHAAQILARAFPGTTIILMQYSTP